MARDLLKNSWATLQCILQVVDKLFAKKFDEQIVSLLLRMYEPTSEGSDLSQFTKLVSLNTKAVKQLIMCTESTVKCGSLPFDQRWSR